MIMIIIIPLVVVVVVVLVRWQTLQCSSAAYVGDLMVWILDDGTGSGTAGTPWKMQLKAPFSCLEPHTNTHTQLTHRLIHNVNTLLNESASFY